jgi:uncharacterized protein (UPF0332 family)
VTSALRDMMAKATQAVTSARLLLDAEDVDGACNRAYYAMFSAARVALMNQGQQPEALKTHGSVIGAFGLHFVKTGLIPRETGKAINDVQEIRLAADYTASNVSLADAIWAVKQAERFVSAVRGLLPDISEQYSNDQALSKPLTAR